MKQKWSLTVGKIRLLKGERCVLKMTTLFDYNRQRLLMPSTVTTVLVCPVTVAPWLT